MELLKQQLRDKLNEQKGKTPELKDKIDNIVDILRIMPEDVDLNDFNGVKYYLSHNSDSRLDVDIATQINNILTELREWVSNNTIKAEGYVIGILNKRTKIVLACFLAVIILLAIAAIACTIAHIVLGDAFPQGETIAEAIGTADFVIGVIGFVVERFDDMGKRELRVEAEKVKAGDSPEGFIKKCNKRKININIGIFNKISEDTHNYYDRNDAHNNSDD